MQHNCNVPDMFGIIVLNYQNCISLNLNYAETSWQELQHNKYNISIPSESLNHN